MHEHHIIIGIVVFCLPAYVFGRNAVSVGDDCTACSIAFFLVPCHCLIARAYIRGKIRQKQQIYVSIRSIVSQ